MKITLVSHGNRGKNSPHRPVFTPWVYKFFSGQPKPSPDEFGRPYVGRLGYGRDSMEWRHGSIVEGDIYLNARGNYKVTLKFEDAELENWLKNYIHHKPQEALELIERVLPLCGEKLKAKAE